MDLRYWIFSSTKMSTSPKILVEWIQGRSKGTTSWLKHDNVKDGRIAIGEKVKVVWGKSKKLHDAIVKDDGTISPSIPIQAPIASIAGIGTEHQSGISFELGSPSSIPDNEFRSPLPVVQSFSTDVASKFFERIEELHDLLSGQIAKLNARLDSVETQLLERLDRLDQGLQSSRPPIATPQPQPEPRRTASTLELPIQTANPVETTIESSFWASSPLQELSLHDQYTTRICLQHSRRNFIQLFEFMQITKKSGGTISGKSF